MKNLAPSFRTCLFAIAFAISASACQPKSEPVDETQAQMREANVALARMTAIDEELRPYGISVRTPTYGSYYIAKKTVVELEILQTKLTDYIAQGSNALRIATRLDVTYGDRAGLAERIGNARMLLSEVKKRLTSGADSTGRFWTTWNDCNSTHRQNLEIYGVRILYFSSTADVAALARLPRDRRREIAVRARRYMECEQILSQGRAQIFEGSNYKPGISKSYDVTGKAIDPLAPIPVEQRNVNKLIETLKDD